MGAAKNRNKTTRPPSRRISSGETYRPYFDRTPPAPTTSLFSPSALSSIQVCTSFLAITCLTPSLNYLTINGGNLRLSSTNSTTLNTCLSLLAKDSYSRRVRAGVMIQAELDIS